MSSDGELRAPLLLLAEDDPDDLFLIVHAWKRVRPDVAIAVVRNGIELLAHLRSRAPDDMPRLLLLDLNMPRMDGREVLMQLRADPQLCRVPVIVLSTSVETEERQRALELQAAGFFSKPEGFGAMVDVLRQLADRWLAQDPGEKCSCQS